MAFRHKNHVLAQENGCGRDFIQGILISFEDYTKKREVYFNGKET
jgi:hypothetical protein